MPTTYWDYVRVEELLRLQGGLDGDERALSNHEVVFITVHQVFELWFKLAIREIVFLRDVFARSVVEETAIASALRSLDRIVRVLSVANQHWTVVESINTRDYLEFRDKLFPASGFQSAQMREMEILLGLEEGDRVGLGGEGQWKEALRSLDGGESPALRRVELRLHDRPTLREAVDAWLFRTPIRGSGPADPADAEAVDGFVREYLDAVRRTTLGLLEQRLDARLPEPARDAIRERYRKEIASAEAWLAPDDPRRRRIRAAILFLESYRELPLLAGPRRVLDQLVEVEQALLVFRQRHARMVERVIGRRVGTGGSTGVQYLDETAIAYRIFKDLWAARTYLLPPPALPRLPDAAFYDFRPPA